MATLKRIRKNVEEKEKREMEKLQNYMPPSSISLLSKTIKTQNIMLIEFICKKYDLSETEKEAMLEHFIKINYYCPNKILSKNKEKLQKIFIK